jgi:hypothetical protein
LKREGALHLRSTTPAHARFARVANKASRALPRPPGAGNQPGVIVTRWFGFWVACICTENYQHRTAISTNHTFKAPRR